MAQEIFNSINALTLHRFVQKKFVQEFVTISLLKLIMSKIYKTYSFKEVVING